MVEQIVGRGGLRDGLSDATYKEKKVTRDRLEICLNKLQIIFNVLHRTR